MYKIVDDKHKQTPLLLTQLWFAVEVQARVIEWPKQKKIIRNIYYLFDLFYFLCNKHIDYGICINQTNHLPTFHTNHI